MAPHVEDPDRTPLARCDPTRLGTRWRVAVQVIGGTLGDATLAAEVRSILETSFLRNVPDF